MADTADDWPLEKKFLDHPVHTLFFTILALNFYALVIFTVIGLFSPLLFEQLAEPDQSNVGMLWRLQIVMQMAAFIHVSLWSEKIGTGPFAGRLAASHAWILVGVIVAPLVYIVIQSFVFWVLLGGNSDDIYRSQTARLMTGKDALGPVMIVALVVAAPLAEEVIYRGVGLGYLLARGVPGPLAIIMMSVAFAALHGQYTFAALVAVFLMGIFLGWLRVHSRSMLPPILAHMAVNLQIVLAVSASGGAVG